MKKYLNDKRIGNTWSVIPIADLPDTSPVIGIMDYRNKSFAEFHLVEYCIVPKNVIVNLPPTNVETEQEVEDKIRQTHANMANREQPLKEQTGELFTSGDWEINMGQIRAPKEFTTTYGEKANGWANICAMSYDVTMSKEEAEANARIICEAPAMYHALKVLAELDLTGVTGEIVYQRNKSKILVKDVLKAKAILSRINGK